MACDSCIIYVVQRRLVTLARTRTLSIDYNIRPCNPGQPAESAKPVHYIQCAGIKLSSRKS